MTNTNTTLNISSNNTAIDCAATAQPNNNISTIWLPIDYHTHSPSVKAVYFAELAKYRKANPLFEVNKREDYIFTPDQNFNKEMRASSKYRIAKTKNVILVSQNW